MNNPVINAGDDDQSVWSTRDDPPSAVDAALLSSYSSFVPKSCVIQEFPDHLTVTTHLPKAAISPSLIRTEGQLPDPDIEDALLHLVSAVPLMKLAISHAIEHPAESSAFDSTAWIVSTVSDLADDLEDLHPTAGEALVKACAIMTKQLDLVLQNPGDMPALLSLQVIASVVAGMVRELDDAANGMPYDAAA
jgi:hypothetical protein